MLLIVGASIVITSDYCKKIRQRPPNVQYTQKAVYIQIDKKVYSTSIPHQSSEYAPISLTCMTVESPHPTQSTAAKTAGSVAGKNAPAAQQAMPESHGASRRLLPQRLGHPPLRRRRQFPAAWWGQGQCICQQCATEALPWKSLVNSQTGPMRTAGPVG
ncbi:hypothetical protein Cenrod_2217 [Candidatus Symbiobacter mobilis CR]|uniref:Uncharacterized protein n=1 Tax=Candidatus Symbiobacter mobilis CR TaxID=946483 RepID=U5NDP1_9BURK|nr:hypothetical protein Cenrod_2217 [Candidatus Symbiobacter mobilis CR]